MDIFYVSRKNTRVGRLEAKFLSSQIRGKGKGWVPEWKEPLLNPAKGLVLPSLAAVSS